MIRKVRLRNACFASAIGDSRSLAMENLRCGRSGIRSLGDLLPGQQVLRCGATIPTGRLDDSGPPLHPRLSPRYNQAMLRFAQQVKDLLERAGPVQQGFLICKRPFYSKWAHQPFCESDFVESFTSACGLNLPLCLVQAACSTGVVALNWAVRELSVEGKVGDQCLLVGVETELNAEKFVAFKKLGALSGEIDPARCCQPFSEGRSGLVPGEVMVALLLQVVDEDQVESGEILLRAGFTNCDASRLTDGLESGEHLARCLERTISPEELAEVDFICPHATSTRLNDALEGMVLSRFLGRCEKPPWIVPLKQYVGHTLNSSGLWEALLTAELLRENMLPSLLHAPDRQAFPSLRFPLQCESMSLRRAMKLSIGFGGINSAILLEKAR